MVKYSILRNQLKICAVYEFSKVAGINTHKINDKYTHTKKQWYFLYTCDEQSKMKFRKQLDSQ